MSVATRADVDEPLIVKILKLSRGGMHKKLCIEWRSSIVSKIHLDY